MTNTDDLSAELEVLARKAGLEIQPDRRTAILNGYREVRAMTELLRTLEFTSADEPANIYCFDPILRSA